MFPLTLSLTFLLCWQIFWIILLFNVFKYSHFPFKIKSIRFLVIRCILAIICIMVLLGIIIWRFTRMGGIVILPSYLQLLNSFYVNEDLGFYLSLSLLTSVGVLFLIFGSLLFVTIIIYLKNNLYSVHLYFFRKKPYTTFWKYLDKKHGAYLVILLNWDIKIYQKGYTVPSLRSFVIFFSHFLKLFFILIPLYSLQWDIFLYHKIYHFFYLMPFIMLYSLLKSFFHAFLHFWGGHPGFPDSMKSYTLYVLDEDDLKDTKKNIFFVC